MKIRKWNDEQLIKAVQTSFTDNYRSKGMSAKVGNSLVEVG